MAPKTQRTDAEVIVSAAANLHRKGSSEFSEWDLTVEAWRLDSNRFGCRGYESDYPDHKRVMMAMAKSKPVIRKGWIQRVRQNYYAATQLGLAVAERLNKESPTGSSSRRSPGPTYSAVRPYIKSSLFEKYSARDLDAIRWYDVEAFLGLAGYSSDHLESRLNLLHSTIREARSWFEDTGTDEMRSGSSGGEAVLKRSDVDKLAEIVNQIESMFAEQFAALRRA